MLWNGSEVVPSLWQRAAAKGVFAPASLSNNRMRRHTAEFNWHRRSESGWEIMLWPDFELPICHLFFVNRKQKNEFRRWSKAMTTTDEGVAVSASMNPMRRLFAVAPNSSGFLRIFVSEGRQILTTPRKGVVMWLLWPRHLNEKTDLEGLNALELAGKRQPTKPLASLATDGYCVFFPSSVVAECHPESRYAMFMPWWRHAGC